MGTLQELHWLKVEQRIEYKLGVLVYRCLHGIAPPYTSPTTSGVSLTSVRGGACARRQHPLSSFLHRGCPLSATVPFPWPRRECGRVCQISSRRQRRCPCLSDTWRLYCSRKATNTGCFRRLEHLPSHVILFAYNSVMWRCLSYRESAGGCVLIECRGIVAMQVRSSQLDLKELNVASRDWLGGCLTSAAGWRSG